MFQQCYVTLRCDFYVKESQIKVHITIQSTLNGLLFSVHLFRLPFCVML